MEPSKKLTANVPPALPAVIPPAKRRWLSRETKLGAIVACSFLAVAGGIMGVKHLLNSPKATSELREYVETPPTRPPSETIMGSPHRVPPTIIEAPPFVPDVHIAPPDPVVLPVRTEAPMIPEIIAPPTMPMTAVAEPIILPPMEPMMREPTAVVAPPIEIPAPPAATAKKDGFSSTLKEPKLDPIDLPPAIVADPSRPEAKNPIIRIGATEPKKDEPPPIEPPPAIEVPPLKVEIPPVKIDMAPKLDAPMEALPMPKTMPDPLQPPKVEAPPVLEVPPLKIETPMVEPKKIEMPPVIEFTPKKDDVPPIEQPKTEIKKDGEYDEDLHTVRPNESYRVISKQYYNSEAYTLALQRYNQQHPGQADYVRIPPIWVLEKKYAGDISASPARAVNYNPSVADVTPRNEPVYTVGDNGEMLADIARQKLGSEEAWKRIWDLNPQVNPAKLVPGGTRLRMPNN